jgi:NAD(P)-dependent dehydrogenase (short-subunit alcohol dehydrogenase family)
MKTAVVWGASGGIGTALAEQLVDEDWRVIGLARDPEAVTERATEVIEMDVADADSVRRAVELVREMVNTVDLWIYAAGDIASEEVVDMAPATWDRIVGANLTGAYRTAHFSLPLLADDGHMIFLGAVSERMRLPGLGAYASAKAGLEALADVLRKEERRRRVTVVRPKAVDTSLWEKVPFSLPKGALSPDDLAARVLEAYRDGESGTLNI